MRIYVNHLNQNHLLDNISSFSKVIRGSDSGIKLTFAGDVRAATNSINLVEGIDEATAEEAIADLLRFTSDDGKGVAVISWNGDRFVRHEL